MTDKPKFCFVISPIGDDDSEVRKEADWVLEGLIKPSLRDLNFDVRRADAFSKVGMITTNLILAIRRASLIVADMTNQNANVFYELGIAHAYEKPVIPIMRTGQPIPFDTAPLGTIYYSRNDVHQWSRAMADIRTAAQEVLSPAHVVSNPVTIALGHEQLKQSADPRDKLLANLQDSVAGLTREVASLSRGHSGTQRPPSIRFHGITPRARDMDARTLRQLLVSALPPSLSETDMEYAVGFASEYLLSQNMFDRPLTADLINEAASLAIEGLKARRAEE
jgi:hypothetical protein